jgi:DNA-binding response OmpR family regulator
MLVLVVASDGRIWEFIHDVLAGDGHVVDRARDVVEASALLALRSYDRVVAHLLPGEPGRDPLVEGPGVVRLTMPLTEGDLREAVTGRRH